MKSPVPITPAAQSSFAEQKRGVAILDSERWLGPLLIGPAVLYIFLLVGVPFFMALYYSVSNTTTGGGTMGFVGLRNFTAVIGTPKFQTALKNTIVFGLISQAVILVLSNALALALQHEFPGRRLIRFLILLPWVAPISIGTIAWLWIFDSTYSVLNWMLRLTGLIHGQGFMWLGLPHLAMGSVIAVHVWRQLPLATVILLAGYGSIPQDIHDAAAVDGAGFWRHFFQITLPLVLPISLVALLFGLIFTFTDMVIIYNLTRGGPFDTTQVLASLAFYTGIAGGDLAEGAAIALFLFPLLLAVALGFLIIAHRAEVT
ncbi:MAG TPA: sugar ABC transporter permease [Candidatus Limnocylindrales bacterium]|jgi:multiple sugar transport system permease protein|nr:sugar ABC transporter permease [Candidatus Limnocylindrales bacterium]